MSLCLSLDPCSKLYGVTDLVSEGIKQAALVSSFSQEVSQIHIYILNADQAPYRVTIPVSFHRLYFACLLSPDNKAKDLLTIFCLSGKKSEKEEEEKLDPITEEKKPLIEESRGEEEGLYATILKFSLKSSSITQNVSSILSRFNPGKYSLEVIRSVKGFLILLHSLEEESKITEKQVGFYDLHRNFSGFYEVSEPSLSEICFSCCRCLMMGGELDIAEGALYAESIKKVFREINSIKRGRFFSSRQSVKLQVRNETNDDTRMLSSSLEVPQNTFGKPYSLCNGRFFVVASLIPEKALQVSFTGLSIVYDPGEVTLCVKVQRVENNDIIGPFKRTLNASKKSLLLMKREPDTFHFTQQQGLLLLVESFLSLFDGRYICIYDLDRPDSSISPIDLYHVFPSGLLSIKKVFFSGTYLYFTVCEKRGNGERDHLVSRIVR